MRTPETTTAAPVPRWAVRAAHLIALIALPSALWRIALVVGFPAGYTDAGFESFETPGSKLWMLTLSMLTELAALASLGLVRPWGEVLPRRLPFLGGRRVHPMAVVLPAATGAVAMTGLWGTMLLWWTYPHDDMTELGHHVVGVLYQPLVLWGPLLGAITVSYYRRTASAASERIR